MALGLGQMLIYIALASWDGYRDRPAMVVLLIVGAASLYLASLWVAGKSGQTMPLLMALAFAAAYRAVLFVEEPFLSDDYFRYLWDGLVQTHGINPYAFAPADPALAGLDDALRARVNHPAVPTIYPPLAQLVFWIIASTRSGLFGLKAVWLACDAALVFLVHRLASSERRFQSVVLYAWSPLLIVEVAWNAHLDPLGALPLMGAVGLASLGATRGLARGIALGLSASVKYFTAAIVPAAARAGREAWIPVLAFIAITLLLYLPYADAGARLFSGLSIFVESWSFNAGPYRMLLWILRWPWLAKAAYGAIVVGVAFQSARNRWSLERAAFWITGSILMFAPTVHPWYLIWIVPLLALRPSRAWIYLSCSVSLSYYGLGTYRSVGLWPQPVWLALIIWGPFLFLLILDAWRGSWLSTAVEIAFPRSGGKAVGRRAKPEEG